MFTTFPRPRSAPARRSFRPTFEALEDRCVPAVLTVNTFADETNDTDVLSLREAILLVNNGGDANLALGRDLSASEQLQVQGAFADNDTIQFASSLGQQTIALANMALPNLLEDVVVTGPSGGLTLDAGQQSRILFVNSGVMAQLSGLTFTRGDEVSGGGIYNSGSLTLTGCTLTGNTASYGGALYSDGVAVTMTDCTVSNNSGSVSTGGLYNAAGTMSLTNCTLSHNDGSAIRNDANLNLTRCTLSDNTADSGGGVYHSSGTVTLTGCTFAGNAVSDYGGGLYIGNGTALVTGCTFSRNSASTGGGIYNNNRLILTNSTVSGNSCSSSAGGIYNGFECTLTAVNSTIVLNRAARSGGGIYDNRVTADTLNNCIVAGNTSAGLPDDVHSETDPDGNLATGSNTLIGNADSASGLSDGTNGNIVGLNGQGTRPIDSIINVVLADRGGPTATHGLLAGSPALNAGANALAVDANAQPLAFDQRGTGFPRSAGSSVDMGAFEGTVPAPVHPTAVVNTLADTIDADDDRLSLREALAVFSGALNFAALSQGEKQQISGDVPFDGVITFDVALASGTIAMTLGEFELEQQVTIIGPAQGITLDAQMQSRVMHIGEGVLAQLSNLNFTHGTHDSGGGIFNEGSLSLTNGSLSANAAEYGGAIYSTGDVLLSGCTLTGNTAATSGGGLYNEGPTTLTNCTFSGNMAESAGGGIYHVGSPAPLVMTGCTLTGNTANDSAGGLYVFAGSSTLTDCTFSNNSGPEGGAIVMGGTMSMIGCSLVGNTASDSAGGIYNSAGDLTLTNCTLSDNSAPKAGAILNSQTISNMAPFRSVTKLINCTVVRNQSLNGGGILNQSPMIPVLNNTIVAGNTNGSGVPNDIGGTVSGSHNLIGDPNSAGGLVHGMNGNILGNGGGQLLPLASLIDLVLADNGGPTLTHALAEGSPALDAGDDALAALLTTDQRGAEFPRVNGLHVDIGAVEADTFFTDTFTGPDEDTLGDEYTQVGGQFRVVNGEAVATGQKPAQAVITQVSAADVAVEADVDLAGKRSRVGLVVRYTPAQGKQKESYYFARLVNRDGRVFAEIRRYHKGEVKVLASRGTNLGGDEHMRFEAVGTALKLFVNGELVVYAQDSALNSPGQVGIRARYGTKIDNLQVFLLNSSPVTLPFADDFSQGSNGNTQLSLSWREQEGNFQIQTTGQNSFALGNADQSTATLSGLSADSLGVQADVELNGTRSNVGFVTHFVRGSKGDIYYWAYLNVDAAGVTTATIVKVVNGKVKSLPNGKVVLPDTFALGTPHELRFITSEGTLQLEIDDVVTVTTTDGTPLSAGSAGLRSSSGTRYDNVQVFQTR